MNLSYMKWALSLLTLIGTMQRIATGARAGTGKTELAPHTSCLVQVFVDEKGDARILVDISLNQTLSKEFKSLRESLVKGFGRPLQDVQQMRRLVFHAHCEDMFVTNRGRIEGDLDLAELANGLRPHSVKSIEVWVFAPPGFPAKSQRFTIATNEPQPVHVVFRHGPDDPLWSAGVLSTLFVLPIALILWRRHVAVHGTTPLDPALVLFRFGRWIALTVLVTWVAWVTAISALDMDSFLYVSFPGTWGAQLRWVATLLPPGLITIFCETVGREVHGRLASSNENREETIRLGLRKVLNTLVPLVGAFLGVVALIDGEYRVGIVWLIAALVTASVSFPRTGEGPAVPYALSAGPLRERILYLAKRAGVLLKEVYILPSSKIPQANAYAMVSGITLSEELLCHLTRREVDAVVAHELAHLRYVHLAWLVVLFAAAVVSPVFLVAYLPDWTHLWSPWTDYIPLALLAVALYHLVLRRLEHQTDSYAAWLTGDAEALITGLIKLSRLNLVPLAWGRLDQAWLTHPSTSLRLQRLARENGISRERLQQLEEQPDQPDDAYPPQADSGDRGLLSSPTLLGSFLRRLRWLQAAVYILPVGLTAGLVWAADLDGALKWGVLAGGLVFTQTLSCLHARHSLGFGKLCRRLQDKLSGQGIDVSSWNGQIVMLTPDGEPRLYDDFFVWDLGFLFFFGDRLCYVGEQARFALQAEQIAETRQDATPFAWITVPYLRVTWHEVASDAGGAFSVRTPDARLMPQLAENLERWRNDPPSPVPLPTELASLLPPNIRAVASTPIELSLWTCLGGVVFLLLCGLGISLLLGLPLEAGLAWYVPAVAMIVFLVDQLCSWWRRRRSRQS
jgi:Zn-dependent protease with chaperone function